MPHHLRSAFSCSYVIIKHRRVAAIDLPDEHGERRFDQGDRRGIDMRPAIM